MFEAKLIGPSARPLCMVLDRTSIASNAASVDVLLELVEHDGVEIISTDHADGAATLELPAQVETGIGSYEVRYGDNRRRRTAMHPLPFWKEFARDGFSPSKATLKSFQVAQAAVQLGADALVTAEPLLLDPEPLAQAFFRDANPMSPEQAAAFLGLCLRLRDDFQVSEILATDRETYFHTVTEAVLPSAWRWLEACGISMQLGNREAPVRLARTTLDRVARALGGRDRVHGAFLGAARGEGLEEAIAQLDAVLVQLAGAFDAVARVANVVYGINARRNNVKWNWTWRTRDLAAVDDDLAAVMDEERAARDVFDILLIFRNTIHGEGLIPVSSFLPLGHRLWVHSVAR